MILGLAAKPSFRPSASERWINCPASAWAPPGESTVFASEGTELHRQCELEMLRCLKKDGTPNLRRPPRHENWAVQAALDEVWNLVRKDSVVLCERKVRFHIPPARMKIRGTADVVILHQNGNADLVDYKMGVGVKVMANNPQMRIYAHAVMQEWSSARVFAHIVQPRYREGYHYDSHLFEKWDGRDSFALDTIAPAIREAKTRKGKARAGDWCKWCSLKPVCDAPAKAAGRALKKLEVA